MKPISFHPREHIFTSDEPDIAPLPVLPISHSDGCNSLVSCWRPGLKDIIRVLIGKPIYLILLSNFQPRCSLSTDRFEVTGREDEQEPGLDYGDTIPEQESQPRVFVLKREMPGLEIGIRFQQSARSPDVYFHGIPISSMLHERGQVGIIEFEARHVEDNLEWFEEIIEDV